MQGENIYVVSLVFIALIVTMMGVVVYAKRHSTKLVKRARRAAEEQS